MDDFKETYSERDIRRRMLEDGVDDWYELWEFVAQLDYSSDSISAAQTVLSELISSGFVRVVLNARSGDRPPVNIPGEVAQALVSVDQVWRSPKSDSDYGISVETTREGADSIGVPWPHGDV